MVALKGKFKGSRVAHEHRFALATTSGSGVLRNKDWLFRLFEEYQDAGLAKPVGPLLRQVPNSDEPIRIAQLDELFHRYLATVQVTMPGLINATVDVEQEYSFRRSVRRGSTTHSERRGGGQQSVEKGGEGRAPRGGPVHVGYVHGCTSGVGFKLAVLGVPLISPGGVDGPWEQIVSTKRSFGCLDFGREIGTGGRYRWQGPDQRG